MNDKDEKEKSLMEAANEAGARLDTEALPESQGDNDRFAGTKGIKEKLPEKVEFYANLPRVEFDKLIGKKFMVHAARLVTDWDGNFGTTDFYLLMVELGDGTKCTTLAGGRAILNQMKKLSKIRGGLPVVVTLNERDGTSGRYRIFE